MLGKRELLNIKKALPENGYQLIADRCNVSKETVRKTLNDPRRFDATLIETALAIIAEHKSYIENLKTKIKEVTA